jgi:hypothetical protein
MRQILEERSTIFKIAVGFIQVLTRLGETYRLRFPVQVTLFFNCMQFLDFLDVFSFSSNLQCAHRPNHLQKITVTTAGSMLVLVVLVLMSSSFVANALLKIQLARRAIVTRIVGSKKNKQTIVPVGEADLQPANASDRKRRFSDFLPKRDLTGAVSTSSAARERWFRAYDHVVLELYQTGVLDKARIRDALKRGLIAQLVRKEKNSVWNLILLFTFMIYPSSNAILMAWFDCQLFEDGRSYLVIDPQIICSCDEDANHPVTLLAADAECDTTIYNNTVNKWYVGVCTILFVGGIPAMYYYILRQSKDILNPRVGALLRDGKKQQQQFEVLRSRLGYRKAVELVKLKARDRVSRLQVQ